MERLGFYSQFKKLTVQCLSNVSYSILLNYAKFGKTIQRSYKKGDPLSLYFFDIITVDTVSRLIALA